MQFRWLIYFEGFLSLQLKQYYLSQVSVFYSYDPDLDPSI